MDSMKEAHRRLIKIVKLIEENYSCDKITVNRCQTLLINYDSCMELHIDQDT